MKYYNLILKKRKGYISKQLTIKMHILLRSNLDFDESSGILIFALSFFKSVIAKFLDNNNVNLTERKMLLVTEFEIVI